MTPIANNHKSNLLLEHQQSKSENSLDASRAVYTEIREIKAQIAEFSHRSQAVVARCQELLDTGGRGRRAREEAAEPPAVDDNWDPFEGRSVLGKAVVGTALFSGAVAGGTAIGVGIAVAAPLAISGVTTAGIAVAGKVAGTWAGAAAGGTGCVTGTAATSTAASTQLVLDAAIVNANVLAGAAAAAVPGTAAAQAAIIAAVNAGELVTAAQAAIAVTATAPSVASGLFSIVWQSAVTLLGLYEVYGRVLPVRYQERVQEMLQFPGDRIEALFYRATRRTVPVASDAAARSYIDDQSVFSAINAAIRHRRFIVVLEGNISNACKQVLEGKGYRFSTLAPTIDDPTGSIVIDFRPSSLQQNGDRPS